MKHTFTFTPAISFFVTCETEQEIQSLSAKLSAGGAELMPRGDYGFNRQFACVTDRFEISWQLSHLALQGREVASRAPVFKLWCTSINPCWAAREHR